MKYQIITITALFLLILTASAFCQAETTTTSQTNWIEDNDGDIGPDEYRKVDPAGATWRRPCPFNCEMRGVPKEHCKEWVSTSLKTECYVQDTSIGGDAMPGHKQH